MSAYVRGTVSTRINLYFQWRNAAGTIISSDGPTSVNHTDAWQRVSRTATAPAGTVSARLLYRFIGPGTATSVTGFMEVDRAQLEIGDTVTGWRDNGSLADSAITANATATTALTARVTQTETDLTSVSQNVTNLTSSIGNIGSDNLLPNSSFEQIGTDGIPAGWRLGSSASMAPTLTMVDSPLSSSVKAVRLTRAGLTNGSYIDLNLNLAAADRPNVVPGQSYTLSAYTRLSSPSARLAMYIQWLNTSNTVISTIQLPETAVGTTFTRSSFSGVAPAGAVKAVIFAARLLNRAGATADMWIEIDNVQFEQGATATGYSPSGASTASAQAATATALDALTTTVTQQGTSITSVASRATALESTVNNTTNGLATKASAAAVTALTTRVTSAEGSITSYSSRITSLESSVNNDVAQALSSLSTRVTNTEGTISAQASSISNLNVVVGNQGAAIQSTSAVVADTYGKVSASYTVKMQAMSDGRLFTAGFGVGLDNSAGPTQSQFIVSADRFGVLNADLNGVVTSPFIIEGGQVFIADAVIKKASITNALIGRSITSQTLTNYGQPVMTTDYSTGLITIQNQTTSGKYMLIRQDGIFSVSAGVIMFELQM
jgi:uncharacterized coiled-coil protein SlyX